MFKIKYVIKYFAEAIKQPKINTYRKCNCSGANNNNNEEKFYLLLPHCTETYCDSCNTEPRGFHGVLQQNMTWEEPVVLMLFHFLENSCSYKAKPEYRDLNSSLDFGAAPLEHMGKLLTESCTSLHICKILSTLTKPF